MSIVVLNGLSISARPLPGYEGDLFEFVISVPAEPFGGSLETVFTSADIERFAQELDAIGPNPSDQSAQLGGGRAALVVLTLSLVNGRGPDLSVQCDITYSEDDPWPKLSVLFFCPPFLPETVKKLRQLLK
jgi:hypothetical protein